MADKTWDVANFDNWTVADFPQGMVGLEAGNSKEYITGGWRSERPVWTAENCTNCMMCWVICPDASILVEDEKLTGIDFDHCKGCGVCVGECRFNALRMVPENSKEA
jgi:pyruvate ferredoxin oxidoreductase delta subunit